MNDKEDWQILFVEDEPDAHDVVTPLLEHHGATVLSAYSAEEALELLKDQHPTVMVIDLALPAMNGWELLKAIRADPRLADIPAVATTAYHSTNVAQEAIAAGFVAFFPKPINARTFVEDLSKSLS